MSIKTVEFDFVVSDSLVAFKLYEYISEIELMEATSFQRDKMKLYSRYMVRVSKCRTKTRNIC